jgi:hypothetical protein
MVAAALPAGTREPVGRYATAGSAEPVPDPILTGVVAQILPGEVGIPRWRLPSLREARHQSDRAPGPVARNLAFGAPAAEGVERAVVRYDLVPLLDSPDEVMGVPLAELRSGDEVDVIGRRAVWVEVRMPNGRAGWVHRTTLENIHVEPQLSAALDGAAGPAATVGTNGDEPDPRALDQLLAAIVAQRRAALATTALATESPADTASSNSSPKRRASPPPGPSSRPTRRQAPG